MQAQPDARHAPSARPVVAPGTAIVDHVAVAGLAGQTVTVYGRALRAVPDRRPRSTARGDAGLDGHARGATDGTYDTDPVTLSVPGYYTYQREHRRERPRARASTSACSDTAETTVATGTPVLVTQVSAQEAAPGDTITDTVAVSGIGVLELPVERTALRAVRLDAEISCTRHAGLDGHVHGEGRRRRT